MQKNILLIFSHLTVYSADLAFWLRMNCTPGPIFAFCAAHHLGVAKSAAIWVRCRKPSQRILVLVTFENYLIEIDLLQTICYNDYMPNAQIKG
jgi:hypothetical protein